MKRSFIQVVLLTLCSTQMVFPSGGQEPVGGESPRTVEVFEPITIIDAIGREVTLDKPLERIAIVSSGAAQAMKILGSWELVVARDAYTTDEVLFPGVGELPPVATLGNPYDLNFELLFGLEVDLLIAFVTQVPGIDELIEKLEPEVKVVALKFYESETMVENFIKLGKILGKDKKAADFTDWYQGVVEHLSRRTATIAEDEKPGVFFKTGMGNAEDLSAFTDEISFAPFRNRITGCINIAGDQPSQGGWIPGIDPEWLASRDIDVLIIGDPVPGIYGAGIGDTETAEAHRKSVMALPAFAGSDAVKNGRVYMLEANLAASPMNILGFAYQAKWFHPELFSDFDPGGIKNDYLTRFMGLTEEQAAASLYAWPED